MKKFALVLVFALIFGVFGSLSFAQATEEPTVEPTPVVTEVPTEPEVPVEDNETVVNVWAVVVALGGAFISGIAAGSLSAVYVLRRISQDRGAVAALEKLISALPEESRQRLLDLANTVDEAVELAKELFDGIPVEEKP